MTSTLFSYWVYWLLITILSLNTSILLPEQKIHLLKIVWLILKLIRITCLKIFYGGLLYFIGENKRQIIKVIMAGITRRFLFYYKLVFKEQFTFRRNIPKAVKKYQKVTDWNSKLFIRINQLTNISHLVFIEIAVSFFIHKVVEIVAKLFIVYFSQASKK